jgi:hypothetical protein
LFRSKEFFPYFIKAMIEIGILDPSGLNSILFANSAIPGGAKTLLKDTFLKSSDGMLYISNFCLSCHSVFSSDKPGSLVRKTSRRWYVNARPQRRSNTNDHHFSFEQLLVLIR